MRRLALILVVVVTAAACGGSSSSPSVVTPVAVVTTDTFTGIVQPGTQNVHSFTVAATPSALSVLMTAAGPPATIAMGLALGNPDTAGNCILLANAVNTNSIASTTTPQLSGTVGASGAYCVVIADVGNAAGPITYSISVSHT